MNNENIIIKFYAGGRLFHVKGDTNAIENELERMGGKWNNYLSEWIFSSSVYEEVRHFLEERKTARFRTQIKDNLDQCESYAQECGEKYRLIEKTTARLVNALNKKNQRLKSRKTAYLVDVVLLILAITLICAYLSVGSYP